MSETQWTGVAVVVLSGLIMGTSPWPLKLMRHFRYEHFAFLSMLLALVILPWAITLAFCPQPFAALREVDRYVLFKANLFALSWGIAQVLAMLCFVRIGVSLTYGILCSIGAAVGVIVPMIVKASGVFQQAPDLISSPGIIILIGTAVMVCGVVFASLAGAGREKVRNRSSKESQAAKPTGRFAVGLLMVVAAGVLSVGWGFTFTYSQAPIVQAMKSHGAGRFSGRHRGLGGRPARRCVAKRPLSSTADDAKQVVARVGPAPSGSRPLHRLRHSLLPAERLARRRDASLGAAWGVGRLGTRARHADTRRANPRLPQRRMARRRGQAPTGKSTSPSPC